MCSLFAAALKRIICVSKSEKDGKLRGGEGCEDKEWVYSAAHLREERACKPVFLPAAAPRRAACTYVLYLMAGQLCRSRFQFRPKPTNATTAPPFPVQSIRLI